jgi:hypothetical protein
LQVTYNGTELNQDALLLRGSAQLPRLQLLGPGSDGPLRLRPTCIGASSSRTVTLHNPSQVAAGFSWVVSRKAQGALQVRPGCCQLSDLAPPPCCRAVVGPLSAGSHAA